MDRQGWVNLSSTEAPLYVLSQLYIPVCPTGPILHTAAHLDKCNTKRTCTCVYGQTCVSTETSGHAHQHVVSSSILFSFKLKFSC